jgi:hypothetical protein
MRRVMWVAVVVAVGGFVDAALGQDQVGTPGCATCGQHQQVGSAAGCGCRASGGVPGCCRCGPSKCDNVWDGFCDEKLRCKQRLQETFWFLQWGRSYEVVQWQSTEVGTAVVVAQDDPEPDPVERPMIAPSLEMPSEPAPAAPQPMVEPVPPEEEAEKTTRWPWIPRLW